MLDDPMLVGRAATIVCEERVNAEWAVQRALDEIAAVFDDVDDPVPARAQGRPARRRRPAAHEPARREGRRRAICCRISTRRAC